MDRTLASLIDFDSSNINHIKNQLVDEYGLNIRSISSIDRSFERALSVCLFENEEEVDSISYTLSSQYDWTSTNELNQHDSYIFLAVEIYGISIHIHGNKSVDLYEITDDCPIVHLAKIKSQGGFFIYLPTEKCSTRKNDGLDDECCSVRTVEDDEHLCCQSANISEVESICSVNVKIRQVQADGNCYFRALSDQINGSEDEHLTLRQLIINFLSNNHEDFETCMDREHFSSWDDFIHQMSNSGTYVDGIIVAASSIFLKKQIIIHQNGHRPMIFKPLSSIEDHDQIHLAYDSKTLHYNSIWSFDENRLCLDENECICV